MQIKKKYMSKDGWQRVVKKKYVCEEMEESIEGMTSLLYIQEVTNPSHRIYNNDIDIKIVDKGFYWLQFGIKNKNYWITAMYNDKKEIVQYYIDITIENIINKNEDSYFYDLFLDVVLLPDGKIVLLDEDELQQALQENVITKEQYDFAYEQAKSIMNSITSKKKKLEYICNKYFIKLLNKIDVDKE